MKPINPGEFRHDIEILEPPKGRSDFGEVAGGWTVYRKTYAAMKPLLGRELYAAMAAESLVRVKFIMRYVPGIKEGWRIRCDGSVYAIISAQDVDARHIETVCYCREVDGED